MGKTQIIKSQSNKFTSKSLETIMHKEQYWEALHKRLIKHLWVYPISLYGNLNPHLLEVDNFKFGKKI